MSRTAREPLWMFEVYRDWTIEVHEDHVRYIDYYEDIAEITFNVDWQ
jgi:hypothetical protein